MSKRQRFSQKKDGASMTPPASNLQNAVLEKDGPMASNSEGQTYPIEEALRAQNALRQMAGLEREQFPIEAFVGMISDEIEILRRNGRTDQQIADAIGKNSRIVITPEDIATNYATPEQRHAGNHQH